jgi:Pyridoxamine 5'-phosphate oxidase
MSSILWCSWSDFAVASPRLANDVRALLELYGQSFGYLATVRRDGGPRVHPVSPVIAEGGLFCFVTPSPKRRDLERDGRYALHAYPAEHSDDEAYLAGRARPVGDELREHRLARLHRASPDVDWKLFEFEIDVAMITHREHRGQPAEHRIWHAPSGAG